MVKNDFFLQSTCIVKIKKKKNPEDHVGMT